MRVQIPPRAPLRMDADRGDPQWSLRSPIRVSTYPGVMRGVRLSTAAVVVVTAGVALSTPPATAAEEPEQVVGLVVTRASGTTAREAQALVEQVVGEVAGRTAVAPGVTAVEIPDLTRAEALDAARILRRTDGISDVGLDTRVTAATNDPYFADQWSLTEHRRGALVDACHRHRSGDRGDRHRHHGA